MSCLLLYLPCRGRFLIDRASNQSPVYQDIELTGIVNYESVADDRRHNSIDKFRIHFWKSTCIACTFDHFTHVFSFTDSVLGHLKLVLRTSIATASFNSLTFFSNYNVHIILYKIKKQKKDFNNLQSIEIYIYYMVS